ncbi:RNA polymerase-associated protein RTF1 homolog [Artemia franciscana]|uniref:RNA polymerase-associated protein RTF1 homolog n=1 Tax=Artemia franciscana TaxID=6661 RepID=UPI0032DB735B
MKKKETENRHWNLLNGRRNSKHLMFGRMIVAQIQRNLRNEKPRKAPSIKSSSSEDSSSSDSEDEERAPRHRVQLVDKKEQISKIRLSRHKLEKWVHSPFLEKVACGCFVRIGIGQNSGKSVYRVAEIVGVCETAKIYNFGNTKTNKGMRLRHGSQERVVRLESVSNQDFTDTEFEKWKETCAAQGVSLPLVEDVDKKYADIQNARNYVFQEEDVAKIIREKTRFSKNIYNYAAKKAQLIKEREIAQSKGDKEVAERYNKELMVRRNDIVAMSKRHWIVCRGLALGFQEVAPRTASV